MTPQEIVDAVSEAHKQRNLATRALDQVREERMQHLREVCAHSTGHVFSYNGERWALDSRQCVFCGAVEPKEA